MAKKVRLKEHGGVIHIPGFGDVHDGNITFEWYQQIVASNPNYAVQFVEFDEAAVPAPKAKNTKTTTDNG